MAYRWQLRRNTEAGAAASTDPLLDGEPGWDGASMKIGDGETLWDNLSETATLESAAGSQAKADAAEAAAISAAVDIAVPAAQDLRSLYLGEAGNYVSTPDHAAFASPTQLELTIRCALDDWSNGANQIIFAQQATANIAWDVLINATGALLFRLSTDGAAVVQAQTAATLESHGFVNGAPRWVRAVWQSSGGGLFLLQYAPDAVDEPTVWTAMPHGGAPPTVALFNSTAAVTVGGVASGSSPAIGRFHRAKVRTTVGASPVADLDLTVPFMSRYRDTTGKTWTLNGSTWAWAPKA